MDALVTLLIFGGCSAVAISFSPIGSAIAARVRGQGVREEISPALLAELDDLRGRVVELEERADFAERVLPRTPDVSRTSTEART